MKQLELHSKQSGIQHAQRLLEQLLTGLVPRQDDDLSRSPRHLR